jgi:hypothetical protein
MKREDIPALEAAFPIEVFYRPPTDVLELCFVW